MSPVVKIVVLRSKDVLVRDTLPMKELLILKPPGCFVLLGDIYDLLLRDDTVV